MMDVRGLLKQVYQEIGRLESLRRQRAMVIEDNSGMKAIQYESEKVCGGRQSDLSEVMENIERQVKRLDMMIAKQLESIMEHREEAYKLLERVPEGPGKSAVQEHYLYRVSWDEISHRLHFTADYVRHLSRECIEELQRICDAEM